jgi:RNA polymerase sigma-70 factor (ECF subfamily)
VINAALMKLRTRRRRPETSLEELLPHFDEQGGWLDGGAALAPSADARLESRQSRELVRRCIAQLPDAYRTVLILRDIEDLEVEPTARALGISISAVKTRLHRARQALRTLLQREMDESTHNDSEATWAPTR